MLRRLIDNLDVRRTAGLVALTAVVILLWDTRLVVPLKILVVFFHELSHAIGCWVTGGRVLRIDVVAAQGGVTVTSGGVRFVTASAGYLGSLAWGGVLLVLASHVERDRWLAGALGAMILAVAVGFVRPLIGFGFVFSVATGVGLIASARYAGDAVNDLLIKTIGLVSCLYAVVDIKSDVLDRDVHSDAVTLARLTGVPADVWGLLWIAIAVVGAAGFVLVANQRRGSALGPR